MKQKENNEKVRKVFLDNLPRKGNTNYIDWMKCENLSFKFQWDNISGIINIIQIKREGKRTKLLLNYNNNEMWIDTSHLINCKISILIGIKTYNYKYNVGDIVKTNTGEIEIIEQIRIPINDKKRKLRSEKGYKYRCVIDGNIDKIMECHLVCGKGCNVCNSSKIIKEVNSIWATNNNIIEYLVNKSDGYKYTHYSEQTIKVKCPDCGNIRKISVVALCFSGFNCPKCGDGISMPNKIMFNILEQLIGLNNFEREYSPEWIGRKLYDFYFELNNNKYIIEMDGGWHNKDNYMSGQTTEESRDIDAYKDEQAKLHGIEVIRIDCDYDSIENRFEYIKQNIFKSKLNTLLTLDKINWDAVLNYTATNTMKFACDLWNNGYRINYISEHLKINRNTIRRYLIDGTDIGLCNYNGIENLKNANSKKVRCVEHNLTFNSITECAEKLSRKLNLKFNIGNIAEVCKGNRKSHQKLHFEFV